MVTVELPPGKHRLRWVSLREPRVDDLPNTALELLLTKSDEVGYFSGGELPVSYTPLNPDLTLELSNEESESVQIEMVFTGRLRRPPPSEVVPNYDDSIAYADLYLGKLEELIGTLGVRDETLFIIVSDHGEGLFAHDTIAHARHVYEDQTRVLWMMRGPDIPKGQIIDQRPALLMDLAPTVLDLLGLGGRGTEGRSLVGCWDGSSCPESDPWWAFGVNEETRGLTSMASYRWPYKWIWRRNTKRTAFDLTTDPWEESDLLAEKVKLNLEPLKTSAEAFQAQRRYLADVLQQSAQTTDTGEN